MKIAISFLMVCLVCFLIVLNMPRPTFSEKYGFPCLGQFIKGKFYPNPTRLQEIAELYKDIKSEEKTTLSKEDEKVFVRGVDKYIRISTIDGQEFVYFNGTDLSLYNNGKHLVQ